MTTPEGAPTPPDPSPPVSDGAPAAPPSAAPPPPPDGWGTPPPGAPTAGGPPPATPPPWSGSWPEPREQRAPGLVAGIVLVVVGVVFLALRLGNVALGPESWPLWLVVPGLAMLAGSLFIPPRGGLGLAVPGTILAMVGAILWVQDAYGLYATWAYAWALVAPTAPGLAMLIYGGVRGDGDLAHDGLRATLTGLGLFVGFGLFFEGVIGISGHRIEHLDQVLPYASIALGILLVVLGLLGGGRRDPDREQRQAQRRAEKERRRAEKAARRTAG